MGMTSKLKWCWIGIFVLAADYFLKHWINQSIPLMSQSPHFYPYGGIGIFKDFLGIEFSINHHINTGAAWGTFQSWPTLLLFSRLILISVMLGYFLFGKIEKEYNLPIVLILSGAVGNIFDYFLYGHVIDMFHFVLWGYDFAVFNLADTAICLAVGWLIILAFTSKETAIAKQE